MAQAKPTIVLTLIVAIICGLLIVTYNFTYKDTSNEITAKLQTACDAVYGKGGEYTVVTGWQEASEALLAAQTDEKSQSLLKDLGRVIKVVSATDGSIAYELSVKGYKDGLDVLVGFNTDGTVKGVSVVSAANETPGLGSKVADEKWLAGFAGVSSDVTIVKQAPTTDNEVQAVTSATYSSNGVAKAVNLARLANELLGGVINECR